MFFYRKQTIMWNLNFIENQPSASFKSDTFCTLGEEMGKHITIRYKYSA